MSITIVSILEDVFIGIKKIKRISSVDLLTMVRFYSNVKTMLGFFIALALLSGLAVYSYLNTRQLISSSRMVAHTNDVLYNAERILAIVVNLEIGQRGYALTGREEFLEPYNRAKSTISTHLHKLTVLTSDNRVQQHRVISLEKDVNELLQFSSAAVNAREKSFEAAHELNASLEGKRLLDAIRTRISEIQKEENNLLEQRISETQAKISKFNFSFISLLITTGIVLTAVFYGINVNLKVRTETEKKLKTAMGEIQDLYDHAPCGYHSLNAEGVFVDINQTLLRWLGYERDEVINRLTFKDIIKETDLPTFDENFHAFKKQGFIHNLEFNLVRKDDSFFPVILSSTAIKDENGHYVKSRSITFDNTERKIAEDQIKELNREMESFSYSVSHDLRAPLRSIDGYAKILQEDYSPRLDDDGQRLISVIMNNGKRMGQLIDDLLDFSRLGRKELAKTHINMDAMVRAIVSEQLHYAADRKINVTVDQLKPAAGDVDMMKQVWTNLLSNAIKYTGKTENSVIEINSSSGNGETIYKIRDNGVGFDMQYVDKLYGVFQRLHKIQDFSGTGVGLAIVKRIVSRHNGKVWAEAKINEGATFYFTIPNNNGK